MSTFQPFVAHLFNRCRLIPLSLLLSGIGAGSAQADDNEHFFETRIRPVLISKCFKCHGGDKVSSELRVDSREALLKGGEYGEPSIVPGKPEESLLIDAIDPQNEDIVMPPDEELPGSVIEDFRTWIRNGAVWPKSPGSGAIDPSFVAEGHWAFRPIERPAVPDVRNRVWAQNEVDQFILAQQEAAGLTPSRRASRETLIRRVSFDLLGLPPTYEEVQAFVADDAPDAWPRLVDRYLSSPQYGERWGRHWLDVARYADTKGYVFTADRSYPFAYAYRDWVIRSLNEDLPYDQFLIRQIAADWLTGDGTLSKNELAAMGFLTLGRRFLNNRHDIIDDRIDVLTRGTMALTVTCARCHDHKYDPISQADYYGLYGVFASSKEPPKPEGAMPLLEADNQFNPYVFLRGQPGNRGPQVKRQFLEVLSGPEPKPFEKGSGRLELAQAIASEQNPLTARVIVNRIWRQHFHASMVTTPSDFGLRCDPPTHPELLDWLAADLIENGWSLKSLHRNILLSATWQQTSVDNPAKRAIDPENRLLWRMNRGRLELEPMRDSILAVAGTLDAKMTGVSVDIVKTPSTPRRTVYGFIDRQNLPALFRTFDFAIPDTHSPGRFQTSVPQQTLYLRNSSFVRNQITALINSLPDSSPSIRIRDLFRRVLSRDPTTDELQRCEQFLSQPPGAVTADGKFAWSYGYGRFDGKAGRLASFTPLPHFTGQAWQGGGKLPDPKLGWVTLRPEGGHPGDSNHAAVLRWTAPRSMTVRLSGTLKNPSEPGNGVEAIAVAADKVVGRWTASNGQVGTGTAPFSIEAGQHVDLIIDNRGDTSHDSFNWSPTLHDASNAAIAWNASRDFHGPRPSVLDNWSQLAQVLVLSNEFQFVD
ncbi:MAG: PSD1 and planctomycete cytochrome C domain-containing protein [Planctomycetota bacterium]|jgi:hypothetical protein